MNAKLFAGIGIGVVLVLAVIGLMDLLEDDDFEDFAAVNPAVAAALAAQEAGDESGRSAGTTTPGTPRVM